MITGSLVMMLTAGALGSVPAAQDPLYVPPARMVMGPGLTVMAAVAFFVSLDAVIVALPPLTAVTSPVALTVATAALLEVHVTVRCVRVLPEASLSVAVASIVCPTTSGVEEIVIVIIVTGGGVVGVERWPVLAVGESPLAQPTMTANAGPAQGITPDLMAVTSDSVGSSAAIHDAKSHPGQLKSRPRADERWPPKRSFVSRCGYARLLLHPHQKEVACDQRSLFSRRPGLLG